MTFRCRTPADTLIAGRAVAAGLRTGDVLALVGGLGAGKTQFVKGLAAGLGLDPDGVTSPTFTLLHEYRGAGARLPLFHSDFYRLERAEEVGTLGLEELFDEGDGVTAVEWADRFPEFLPPGTRWWRFTTDADGAAPSWRWRTRHDDPGDGHLQPARQSRARGGGRAGTPHPT